MKVEFSGRKAPRWAVNLAQREADTRPRHLGPFISVRWMKCGRGCPHGRAFPWRDHVRIYASGRTDEDKSLLIHELAHLADRGPGSHGPTFYREAIRIAKANGHLRKFLNWQGRMAKAEYRKMLREERQAA